MLNKSSNSGQATMIRKISFNQIQDFGLIAVLAGLLYWRFFLVGISICRTRSTEEGDGWQRGAKRGGITVLAIFMPRLLKKAGIELEVMSTAGSIENISLLEHAGKPVDIAILQGGILAGQKREGLKSLGRICS